MRPLLVKSLAGPLIYQTFNTLKSLHCMLQCTTLILLKKLRRNTHIYLWKRKQLRAFIGKTS